MDTVDRRHTECKPLINYEDAFTYEAFSAEYIANLLEQRARFTPEASALHLTYLKLAFIAGQYMELAKQAAHKEWSHVDYLARLIEGEAHSRRDRATQSRIRLARFPVIKTLEQFRWDWPTRMNRLQVQHHFRLEFIQAKANLILLGGVGLGKTHLATALGYTACLQGYSVLFVSAIDVINTLTAAKGSGRLKPELTKYTKPALLILDELGYLPIDKTGADLLFQIISLRASYYESPFLLHTTRPSGRFADAVQRGLSPIHCAFEKVPNQPDPCCPAKRPTHAVVG